MARCEQFEVHSLNHEQWDVIAWFADFELARVLARERRTRVRLVQATYEGCERIGSEVLVEIGVTKEA